MNRNRIMVILGIGFLIIGGGALAGLLIGRTIPADLHNEQEATADPVERFELGRDSYTPPKVATRKQVTSAPNENVEYGARRNGKRLLVPNEPAKKKERDQLMREQREHDAWRMEAFGEDSQLSKAAAADANIYPASEPIAQPVAKVVKNTSNQPIQKVVVDGKVQSPERPTDGSKRRSGSDPEEAATPSN